MFLCTQIEGVVVVVKSYLGSHLMDNASHPQFILSCNLQGKVPPKVRVLAWSIAHGKIKYL
jgi:hypothetical protein